MAEERKSHFRLGAFVLVTVATALLILFALGGRDLLRPSFTFETYFKESVAGLEIGAPVRLRGVPLGTVSEIQSSSAIYEKDVPVDRRRSYIVVRAKISYSNEETLEIQREVKEYIKRGIRAQTQLAGITGQQYLSIDFFDPEKNPPLPFDWKPKYDYVPSVPSLTTEIISNAQRLLAGLSDVKLQEIAHHMDSVLVKVSTQLDDMQLGKLTADADSVMVDARAAITRVNKTLDAAPIADAVRKIDTAAANANTLLANPHLERTVENVSKVSDRLRTISESGDLDRLVTRLADTADRLDGLIGANQYDADQTIKDLRVTAENLRILSEEIKRNPAGAIVSGPPKKVSIPGDRK